ncbi:VOC family protein [Bacillus mobilis]|uniref:VOC family protein n=1 Tax=Bacillus mobilis TaxID=2026190 RepID=UPI0022E337BA|nr:VOC family protein [Bacillus mobilis]MED0952306.1 VOC family protein [Bacillus mobilis]MED0998193.1 VOC family protein [Bacillus mobilis]MED1004931.1 VOC family protein [Bacillus mobilis]
MNHLFRVQLYVNDIEKSLLFYEEVIGLQLYKKDMHAARFNHDQFSLLLVSDSRLNENHYFYNRKEMKGNGFELIIVVNRIEEVYERCKEKRCTIQEEIQTYPWEMRGFKVTDPDGYFLRITSE